MVEYNTRGDPTETGIYACRVSDGLLWEDIFLCWDRGCWYRLSSDQRFRRPVAGWIGPLQRKMPATVVDRSR